ncbi:hypothetical protein VNO80_19770 [Phaseolus coccineus]|uniref:Uncharacterized protein n=1 Tax=Phaseolus coccineus TaxID=3886 RepID=A0AAN9MI04_PHACN
MSLQGITSPIQILHQCNNQCYTHLNNALYFFFFIFGQILYFSILVAKAILFAISSLIDHMIMFVEVNILCLDRLKSFTAKLGAAAARKLKLEDQK